MKSIVNVNAFVRCLDRSLESRSFGNRCTDWNLDRSLNLRLAGNLYKSHDECQTLTCNPTHDLAKLQTRSKGADEDLLGKNTIGKKVGQHCGNINKFKVDIYVSRWIEVIQ